MRITSLLRRATPLALAVGVAACDVVDLVQNPQPRFEQTWNVPADSTAISVGPLLPGSVSIYSTPGSNPPDSSAFLVSLALSPVSRVIGLDCSQCQTLDGQTTVKPPFVLSTGSTTNLPTDVVSGALVGGQINIQVTNGLSFDPIRVKTGPGAQGWMLIVVRSNSLVIARDSVNGATTAFAPGAVLNRSMVLQSGTISGGISVDVTINSPAGDHNVPINASGQITGTASVPDFRFTQVRMNVANRTLASAGTDSIALDDLDEALTDHVTGAALEMTISNPFAVAGTVNMRFAYGPLPSQAVVKTFSVPTGVNQVRTVSMTAAEMQQLFGNRVSITIDGGVSSTAPIDVTPKQAIHFANRLILTVLTGGSN